MVTDVSTDSMNLTLKWTNVERLFCPINLQPKLFFEKFGKPIGDELVRWGVIVARITNKY
jgi:hypothetical protein